MEVKQEFKSKNLFNDIKSHMLRNSGYKFKMEKSSDRVTFTGSKAAYLEKVANNPKYLTNEQARVLILRFQEKAPDAPQALTRMLTGYEDLVRSIAYEFSKLPHVLDDLMSEGNEAIIRAAGKAKTEHAVNFMQYIEPAIRGRMINFLHGNRDMHYSGKVTKDFATFRRVKEELANDPARDFTKEEIMREMGITETKYHTLEEFSQREHKLQDTIGGEEDLTFEDTIKSYQSSPYQIMKEKQEERGLARVFKKNLSEQEHAVMQQFFVEKMSIDEIAKNLNLNKSRTIEHITGSLEKLLDCPEFLELKSTKDIRLIKLILKRYETEAYINKLSRLIPEFVPIIATLKQGNEKVTKAEVKAAVQPIVEKADLTDIQRKIVDFICELNGNSVSKNQHEAYEAFNSTKSAFSKNKIQARQKIRAVIEAMQGLKQGQDPTLHEIIYFSRNVDEVIRRSDLTDLQKQVLDATFDSYGVTRDHKYIAKDVGLTNPAQVSVHLMKIYKKLLQVVKENRELTPQYPSLAEMGNPNVYGKYLKVLANTQKKIVDLKLRRKENQEIAQETGIKKLKYLQEHLFNAIKSLQRHFPNSFKNIEMLLKGAKKDTRSSSYLMHAVKIVPEFEGTIKELVSQKGGDLQIEDVKTGISEVIGKAGLSPQQKEIMSHLLGLTPDGEVKTQKEIATIMKISTSMVSSARIKAVEKIQGVLGKNSEKTFKPAISLHEILVFSNNLETLIQKTNENSRLKLTSQENSVLEYLKKQNGRIPTNVEIAENVGMISNNVPKIKQRITQKLINTIETNSEFELAKYSPEEMKNQAILDKFMKILTDQQRDVVILTMGNQSGIASALRVSKGTIQVVRRDILKKWQEYFPSYYTHLESLIKKDESSGISSKSEKILTLSGSKADVSGIQIQSPYPYLTALNSTVASSAM